MVEPLPPKVLQVGLNPKEVSLTWPQFLGSEWLMSKITVQTLISNSEPRGRETKDSHVLTLAKPVGKMHFANYLAAWVEKEAQCIAVSFYTTYEAAIYLAAIPTRLNIPVVVVRRGAQACCRRRFSSAEPPLNHGRLNGHGRRCRGLGFRIVGVRFFHNFDRFRGLKDKTLVAPGA